MELDIIEDHSSDVVSILFSQGFVWSGLNSGEEVGSVSLDGGFDLSAEISSVVVSLSLRVGDSE